MYAFTYYLNNTACIIIMLLILKLHLKSLDKTITARVFTFLIVSVILYFIFDLCCGLLENDVWHKGQMLSTIFNLGFFFSSYLIGYFAFMYSECEINNTWMFNNKKLYLSFIPTLILIVLTFLTLKFRFFFYIDINGEYIKGSHYFLVLLFVYGYLLLIGIKNFILYFNKKYYLKKEILLLFCSFVIFPLIFGIIQAFHTGISIICLGTTISIVQVFISMQNKRITIDSLTKLNNRDKLMQHLDSKINNVINNDIYFVMIDIDNLKHINDTFGHVEGDRAIKTIADILKQSCGHYTCMLARYAGDEFSIVFEGSLESVEKLKNDIYTNLKVYQELTNGKYNLEVSLGYSRYDRFKMKNIVELIASADAELYKEKARKKKHK